MRLWITPHDWPTKYRMFDMRRGLGKLAFRLKGWTEKAHGEEKASSCPNVRPLVNDRFHANVKSFRCAVKEWGYVVGNVDNLLQFFVVVSHDDGRRTTVELDDDGPVVRHANHDGAWSNVSMSVTVWVWVNFEEAVHQLSQNAENAPRVDPQLVPSAFFQLDRQEVAGDVRQDEADFGACPVGPGRRVADTGFVSENYVRMIVVA